MENLSSSSEYSLELEQPELINEIKIYMFKIDDKVAASEKNQS